MSRYNLIDEPWIPVRDLKGNRLELGIQETLLRAKELEAIEDPSPLVTAAVHRFLLAVLYRALMGPTDIGQAKTLFSEGFPAGKISTYLKKWKTRFFLFDEKYPFGQIQPFTPKVWRSWTVLAAEHNADNAKVLFDHVDIERPGSISPAACVRLMLATQTFSVSCGKSELSHTATAPSATAAMVLPLGRDLRDTLIFSLVPQNRRVIADDLPIWERDVASTKNLENGPKRKSAGWADRYTWMIRAICLAPEAKGEVARLAFASGVKFVESDIPDPMLGYRIDDKNGKLPIQFCERGIWRDFDSLLPDQGKLCPLVMENAVSLSKNSNSRYPRSVMVVGQRNNKAKIEYWRMERFVMPESLVEKPSFRSDVRGLLEKAEDAQKSLWFASNSFARDLLSRGTRLVKKDDIRKFVDQMPVTPWYWSTLEAKFHEILGGYSSSRNPDDIRLEWLVVVRNTLRDAWEQHRMSISLGDSWAIRALAKAEGPILQKIRDLNKQINPEKEVA